jgi:nucleoside-triphosphatase THEP1
LSRTAAVAVITGPVAGGKTRLAFAVAAAARAAGLPVAGFAQPGEWEGGQKVRYRIVDLATGASGLLASRVAPREGAGGTSFCFDPAGFLLAEAALRGAKPGAVLLADELGPLEASGGGHVACLARALAVPELRAAVLVIRRGLVETLVASLGLVPVLVHDVEGRHPTPARSILSALGVV